MDEATTQAMFKQFYDTTVDDVTEASEIYADDAMLEFPQGRERIRGKANIIAFRSAYPANVTIEVHRITGRQELWVNELTLSYDGTPMNVVSIMEIRDGKIVHERNYYGETWEPPAWRAQWVEPMAGASPLAVPLSLLQDQLAEGGPCPGAAT
jgi:limonene-1,2-epoxide hydrolase